MTCDFFTGKISKEEMFFNSYKEKISAYGNGIYGLLIIKSDDKRSFEIFPMTRISDRSIITYDVSVKNSSGTKILAEKNTGTVYELPSGTSGQILVKSYVDGVLNNSIKENYTAF